MGEGPLLLVTLLAGVDSETAPGKDPGKNAVVFCLPALATMSGSHRETQSSRPSQAEQCRDVLRPLQAGLALGFLPTVACLLRGWVGLSRREDIRAGSPCPFF